MGDQPITAYDDVIKYASKDTEHAHQTALMMWIAHAAWEVNPENSTHRHERTAFWHRGAKPWMDRDGYAGWCTFSEQQIEWLASPLLHAIPNGGARDRVTAARMRDEGVKSGVADLFLAVPTQRRGYGPRERIHSHGLYIEMKRPKSVGRRQGKASDAQEAFRELVVNQGYEWVLAVTWHEALEALWTYLNG